MKNDFAVLLYQLVHEAGIKMVSISTATGYDLSYVSKWMSGKMLPSEKCIETISDEIAECICSSDNKQLEQLLLSYGCADRKTLHNKIHEALLRAFLHSKNITKNKSLELYSRISIGEVLQQTKLMSNSTIDNAIVIVDLFNLDRDSRLEFAGIRNGRHDNQDGSKNANVTIVVCLDDIEDDIYDCLYLLHLISIFSNKRLSLYNSKIAIGKVLYIVNQQITVTGIIFPKDKTCIAVSVADDSITAKQLLQVYSQQLNRGNIVFRAMSFDEFVQSKSYIKFMLTEGNRWLIGHITELLLPDELFVEMLNQITSDDQAEYKTIYDFAQGIIQQGKVSILFYETVISDLLATGEIDFFNHKMLLDRQQINKFLEYLIGLNASKVNYRMIKTGFSSHFEHLYNPCLFVSDTDVFMRLENAYDRDSVLVFIDPNVKKMIGKFYDAAWNNRPDVVIKDERSTESILMHYRTMNLLLN